MVHIAQEPPVLKADMTLLAADISNLETQVAKDTFTTVTFTIKDGIFQPVANECGFQLFAHWDAVWTTNSRLCHVSTLSSCDFLSTLALHVIDDVKGYDACSASLTQHSL